jgi:hypothetical protein
MEMKRRLYIFLAFILIMLSAVTATNSQPQQEDAKDIQNQAEKISKLQRERAENIKFLLDIIKDDSKIQSRLQVLAVEALGHIRAEEAAPILIENIDSIHPPVKMTSMEPCKVALIKIGKASSRLALEELGKDMTDNRRLLLTQVIHKVEGYEVGTFIIERAIKSAGSLKAKENLGKSLDLIKKLKDK